MDIAQNITAIMAMARRLQYVGARSGSEPDVYKLAKDIMMEAAILCETCSAAEATYTVADSFKRMGWVPPSEAK
jgi:hypothetical protein